jgi:hypothetical protein
MSHRISWDIVAIIRVGDVLKHGISLQDFKHPMLFWQNIEEWCTFEKIYGVGKIKLNTKWPYGLKIWNLVENLK